jgi:uncharacterized protein
MGTDSNLEIIKRAYERWGREKEGSFDCWVDILADDVRWRSLAAGARGMDFTTERGGKPAVRDYFVGMARDWEMLHYTPELFVAEGDWVVMRGACGWRHRRSHKRMESPKADFFRLKDGKIVEFFEFYDTAAALAATQ